MKKKNLFKVFCLAALTTVTSLQLAPVRAADRIGEDIYLFSDANKPPADLPNVLFLIDNTANWETPFSDEMQALINAFNSVDPNKFRVGLMMFTETGSGGGGGGKGSTGTTTTTSSYANSNVDGGYVRAAIRTMDADTKVKYGSLIASLDKGADKSNGGKAGKTMVEVYRYLTGTAPYAGNNKQKTDFTGNKGISTASDAIYAMSSSPNGNALSSYAGTTYTAPPANGCGGTYVIYLSNGPVQDNIDDTKAATSELTKAGAGKTPPNELTSWTDPITLAVSGSQDNVADEWARFMYKTMGVTFFTIDVVPKATGQTPGWSSLLRSISTESAGTYYDLSKSSNVKLDLDAAFGSILSKIQSVNSAFSSVSLPVSVNTQGTYLNQVFMGMFRPNSDALPRWYGNLKQYKVGVDSDTGNLYLSDKNDKNAVNAKTGFIDACASSFWTPTAADSYWDFAPTLDNYCYDTTTKTTSKASNSPDGANVEKGAQAYVLRSVPGTPNPPDPANRKMLTCKGTDCSTSGTGTLANFNDGYAKLKQEDFDSSTGGTNYKTLIEWARGADSKGDERRNTDNTPFKSKTVMRPSVHGDVIHSRPVAINYGSDASPQVVVFYGGNDGALRAVAGNRSAAASTGQPAGSELWSFMPPEFYGKIKRTYDNSVQISYPDLVTTDNAPTPVPKYYGMDGPVTAYQSADSSKIWLYAAMRRGGRSIYAFDVSSMGSPTLKWRRGCDEENTCTENMSGIGQTWSSPKVFRAPGFGGGNSPLLIFGGGYDTCEDNDTNNTCNTSTKGNHIYVMNADTGALLKTFDTQRAVPGDITVINDSKTGLAKIAYAADTGGNVYRIDLMGDSTKAPDAWTMTRIASLGCDTVTTCTPHRKFLYGPDVVEDSGAYVVLLGSGDREKPLSYYTNAFSVSNYFFMLVDKPSVSTWLTDEGKNTTDSICGSGNNFMCLNSLQFIGSSDPSPTDLSAHKGWYLSLAAGEQVVTSSVTARGTTTFSTHIPSDPNHPTDTTASPPLSCKSDLGKAQVYNISYLNASNPKGRAQTVATGGLSPSPVLATVKTDDGVTRDVCFGCGQSFPEPSKIPNAISNIKQSKGRVYWYIQR